MNTIATDTAEAVRNIAPAVAELSDQARILTDFIKKMKAIYVFLLTAVLLQCDGVNGGHASVHAVGSRTLRTYLSSGFRPILLTLCMPPMELTVLVIPC